MATRAKNKTTVKSKKTKASVKKTKSARRSKTTKSINAPKRKAVKEKKVVKPAKAKTDKKKSVSVKRSTAKKSSVKKTVVKAAKKVVRRKKPLNIAFMASEAIPFVKTGGLADVMGSLPLALKEMGHNVVVFIPEYLSIHEGNFNLQDTGVRFSCPVGSNWLDVSLSKYEYNGLDFYFVKYPPYFMRSGIYGENGDYEDNLERFTLFSKACIEGLVRIGFRPDIIHANDWHTGLVPVFLKAFYAQSSFFENTKTVFSIHNIAYQGVFGVDKFHLLGLDWSYFSHQALEFYGKINLLKAGIVFSDKITTVSPQFAKEIQTPDFGYGLDGVLRNRKDDLCGILNGIDQSEWDPWNDEYIIEKFGIMSGKAYTKGKALCKADLCKECSFDSAEAPIIGMVSRLSEQKGIDLFLDTLNGIMQSLSVNIVILGTGDHYYEQALMGIAPSFSGRLKAVIRFDNVLAHKIYAGADLFLMPSRYEPCGLSQMIAMRYGAIPIVRACGGLKDTVKEDIGFLFSEYSPKELKSAVEKAVNLYYNGKKGFNDRRKKAMAQDFSWASSAKEYDRLYRVALK